ncbi:von Willebrand factor type A domain-containing protein [Suillus subaureus]|uniref:von Willebrand factor type A domain-containing protein n=1 Tax=Suillus subaureus TaxID=48587 RepID=A0A9P7E312_9AGAM|nr:von Willebrand factor type A domain-containing protein [Suillus subaureus]KAG1809579.1 von Willebrand factor type A domain-containing protein [Suillus subaureus]
MASMNGHAGIVHRSPDQRLLHLPLQEVNVKVWMVDVSARVVLSQVFENVSESPTSRAKYVFPLPESAAACAFELEHADGRVIVGVAKEKSEAAQAFQSAVDAGKTAGLVEWVTDDIFTISIGSIPARKKVTARLTFVIDLLDNGRRDQVRLQLPMAIAERYGETPVAMLDASTTNEKTIIKIAVDVQASDKIQEIRSPTHPTIAYKRYKSRTGKKSERRMRVTWWSTTFLDKDFVLTVHALGLDKPRCFAEVDPQGRDTIAMQLSLVPNFKIPPLDSQEYIFVIDRSGSMSGAPMETAKRTLEMLLHLLPDSQTTFNIFSFGTNVDGLWGKSVTFNQTEMRRAILSVQGMEANYGGTEIAQALQFAIASRNCDRPTAMFVLTDGDIHTSANLDPFTVVSRAVKGCKTNAQLRVFTLGIGESVSSAMCERLAREGGGKCAMLLNAGRTREIESVTIDWHGLGSPPAVNFSPLNHHHPLPPSVVQLEPPPSMQQGPPTIRSIFPGMRLNVFAITTFSSIPHEVRLHAKIKDSEEVIDDVVLVTEVKPFRDEWSSIPLLHTLAARQLVEDLAEGRAPLPKPVTPASDKDIKKAAIVRLGLGYQLVSQHTSFFAEESGHETARTLRRSMSWQRSRRQHGHSSATGDPADDGAPETDVSTAQTILDSLSQAVYAVFNFLFSDPPPTTRRRQKPLPGTYHSAAQSRSDSPSIQSEYSYRHDNSSTDTFSTLSSLEGSSTSSRWSDSRPPSPVPPPEDPIQRAPSPVFNIASPGARPPAPPRIAPPVPKEAYAIISLQNFDGSFTPSPELGALVGIDTLAKAGELQVDGKVWATAVVVAYLKHHLGSQQDLLDALMNKALEYINRGGARLLVGRDFWDLVNTAGQSVGS